MDNEYTEYLEASKTSKEEFMDLYGFQHDCHCAQDWETGAVGTVSECWMQMSDDALERCHKFKAEVANLERDRANLRNQVAELGGEPRV